VAWHSPARFEGEFGGVHSLTPGRAAALRDRFASGTPGVAAADMDESASPQSRLFVDLARKRSVRRAEAPAVQQPRQIFFSCAFIRASSWVIGSTYFVSFVSAFATGATRRADDAGGAEDLS
jgi:hypothetical protein